MAGVTNLGSAKRRKDIFKTEIYSEVLSYDQSGAAISAVPSINDDVFNLEGVGVWSIEAFRQAISGTQVDLTLTFTKCYIHPDQDVTVAGKIIERSGIKFIKTESTAEMVITADDTVGVLLPSDFANLALTSYILVEVSSPSGTFSCNLNIRALGA